MPKIPGVIKGMGLTAKTMKETLFPEGLKKPIPQPSKGAATVQYPHEREEPPTRARGVIALKEDKIVISRTAASIDAIPASHSIGVEVREKGRPELDFLVREGDQLPKKGKKMGSRI